MRKILSFLAVFFLLACQHISEAPTPEVSDLVTRFRALDNAHQKTALDNEWGYFTQVFDFGIFQDRLLKEFPSLGIFGKNEVLLGQNPLDQRALQVVSSNTAALLLAIDLEMELLSRFHSSTEAAPRCLENFWSEWALPVPRATAQSWMYREISQVPQAATSAAPAPKESPDESSKKLATLLKQSLGLGADAKVQLIKLEESNRAQFEVADKDKYEIFQSPVDCNSIKEKKYILPALGQMHCLQKKSSTWVTMAALDSTEMSDDWPAETHKRCTRWVRPLSDKLRADVARAQELRTSALAKSWSLYPRLRTWVLREADRYELAFRQSIK